MIIFDLWYSVFLQTSRQSMINDQLMIILIYDMLRKGGREKRAKHFGLLDFTPVIFQQQVARTSCTSKKQYNNNNNNVQQCSAAATTLSCNHKYLKFWELVVTLLKNVNVVIYM